MTDSSPGASREFRSDPRHLGNVLNGLFLIYLITLSFLEPVPLNLAGKLNKTGSTFSCRAFICADLQHLLVNFYQKNH